MSNHKYIKLYEEEDSSIPNSDEPESISERLAKEEIRKLRENTEEIEKLKEKIRKES